MDKKVSPRRRKFLKVGAAGIATGIGAVVASQALPAKEFYLGKDKRFCITIGTQKALAAGLEADYVAFGADDHVVFQQALDALPAVGGQLLVLAGTYVWGAGQTVTRAIDNVSIVGVGASVEFTGDGATPLFTAGGDRWMFSNFRTDAGGLEMGATADYLWLNIHVAGVFHAIVPGAMALHDNTFHNPNFAEESDFNNHSARHELAGADVLNVAGLSGELADDQPPKSHDNTKHTTNYASDHDLSTHVGTEAAPVHGSTDAATFSKIVHRDAAGRAKVANPNVDADIDNQGARNAAIEDHRTGATHALDQPPASHDNAKHSTNYEAEGVAAAEVAAHKDLTTGVHGVPTSQTFGHATSAEVSLYVDAAAGNDANAGTSGSPKATILGALDALPAIIAHACTIHVRGQQSYAEGNQQITFARFNTLTPIIIKAVNASDEDMYDDGIATGGGNNYLDDSAQSWSANQFNGAYVTIFEGTGRGQLREISATAATRITVSANWTTNPDATSRYSIIGGATMSAAVAFHVWADGFKQVNIYGFRHTGATSRDFLCSGKSIGYFHNNYCGTAIGVSSFLSRVYAYFNYFPGTTGIQAASIGEVIPQSNVFMGCTTGLRLYDNSQGTMGTLAGLKNYFAQCTKGILIQTGSGCRAASDQGYGTSGDANTADIDPATSTIVPAWWT